MDKNIDYDKEFWNAGNSSKFDGEYDPKELEMGIAVEYEHTTNRELSKKIATDHLAEISDYYTRLKRMEEEAKTDGVFNNQFEKKDENSEEDRIYELAGIKKE